jgi:uncharacterized protein with HEPN domain
MPSEGLTDRRWLSDIQYHGKGARHFVAAINYETFRDDLMRLHTVTRCLEIISEASRRLPDEMKARHPSISRKEMAAAGNIYRHDYEDVAASYVWVTVRDHLPPLLIVIDRELGSPQ